MPVLRRDKQRGGAILCPVIWLCAAAEKDFDDSVDTFVGCNEEGRRALLVLPLELFSTMHD